jgi:putative transposase
MEERVRFVSRRLEGEPMAAPCRGFGISRKTGHKIFARYSEPGLEIFARYSEPGLEALRDQSRRPRRNAKRLPMPVEAQIVALKREKPHWGGAQACASS